MKDKLKEILKMKDRKKILSIFLAVLMIVSSISCCFSAFAATGDSFALDLSDTIEYGYGPISYKDGSTTKTHSKNHITKFHKKGNSNDVFYCIRFGAENVFSTGTENGTGCAYFKSLSSKAQNGIKLATSCGYGYNGTSQTKFYYAATQALVWEYQLGYRTSPTSHKTGKGTVYTEFVAKNTQFQTEYNTILNRMKSFSTKPSFCYVDSTTAANKKTDVSVNADGNYVKTFTDTNKVLTEYVVESKSNNLADVSISGNNLTIKVKNPGDKCNVVLKHKTASINNIVLTKSGDWQELAGRLAPTITKGYVNIQATKGSIKLTKTVAETVTKDTSFTFTLSNTYCGYSKNVSIVVPKEKASASTTVTDIPLTSTGALNVKEKDYAAYTTGMTVTNAIEGTVTSKTNSVTFHIKNNTNKNDTNENDTTVAVNCTNTFIEKECSILKLDMNTQIPLAGAEFTIYSDKACKNVYTAVGNNGIVTSGTDGYAKFKLPAGTYYVKETKAPGKYKMDSDQAQVIKVDANSTSKDLNVIFTDTIINQYSAQLVIIKKDKDSGKYLENAKFTLYKANDDGSMSDTGYFDGDNPGVITNSVKSTDATGTVIVGIPMADATPITLYVKETTAPNGYIINNNKAIKVTLKPGDNTEISADDLFKVDDNKDLPKVGDTDFYIDGYAGTPEYSSIVVKTIGNDNELIPSSEVTVSYKGKNIATGFSNKEGLITFNNVIVGEDYTIKQSKTNLYYNVNATPSTVKATAAKMQFDIINTKKDVNANLYISEQDVEFEDTQIKFDISKIDNQTQTTVAGATIAMYNKNDYKAYQDAIDAANKLTDESAKEDALTNAEKLRPEAVFTGITGENGKFTVSGEKINPGDYVLKELEAPVGYALNPNTIDLSIVDNKNGTYDIKGSKVLGDDETKAVITKTDLTTSEPVPGATIEIYSLSDEKDKDNNPITTLYCKGVTDDNGKLEISKIPVGTYMFKETIAPDGFIVNKDSFIFSVNLDGSVTGTTTLTDEHTSVMIHKLDTETGKDLANVEFTIFDKDNKEVTKTVTNEKGIATVEYLPVGTYTVKETKYPEGYVQKDIAYTITIDEAGKVTGELDIKNAPTNVTIYKYDSKTNKTVAGATIAIYDTKGKQVAIGMTNKDGSINVKYLPVGSYSYKEIKAPAGYKIDSKAYKFVINKDGSITGSDSITDDPTFVIITKYNTKHRTVEGATVGIYDAKGKLAYQGVTNKDGQIAVEYLKPGNYTFRELKAPEGYKLNTTEFSFCIDKDGNVKGDKSFVDEFEAKAPMTGGQCFALAAGLIALASGGAFVFLNKEKIFKKKKVED